MNTPARNRFLAATPEEARERLELQSALCLDLVAIARALPWIETNAGARAEAAAHWAFILAPELRVNDEY